MFQQDGAPANTASAHTANLTQRFLEKTIMAHWSKEVWSSYLPELNPCDYDIWVVLQTKVNTTAQENINTLRRTIRREWKLPSEVMIWHTCRAFRLCLERVVATDGGYTD